MKKPVTDLYDLGVPHNIFPLPLPDGTYYPDHLANYDERPEEFLAGFNRCRDKDWSDYTFMDLGCSEGSTTLKLGQSGARTYGIEGRADAVERANALKAILEFDNVDFKVGNVDHEEIYHEVDGLYNAGILYHLEDPVTFLERCAANTRHFMYVDTGHAPRSQEELEGSKFNPSFGDRFTIDYKGLTLDVINFDEPRDTGEKQKDGTRRKPRSGIGNTNSVWLSHASLVDLMRELGFPYHEVVSDRPIIPRLRTCFWREEPGPKRELGDMAQPLPPRLPQAEAVAITRERDIAYLQKRFAPTFERAPWVSKIIARLKGHSVTALGRAPLLPKIVADLERNGITVGEVIEIPGNFEDPIGLGHLLKLCEGKSGPLAIAVHNTHGVVLQLMLLDRFDYIFTSFGMYNATK